MRIVVGSLNPVKIAAVHETIYYFESFKNALIESVDTPSHVREQPLGLQEIVLGARNRAHTGYTLGAHDLAIGIESGIVSFTEIPQQHFNMAACALYDGKNYHIGYASGLPIPPQCTQLIMQKKLTWAQAATHVGIIDSADAPRSLHVADQDVILTHGLLSRKEHIKQALISALIPFINPTWFCAETTTVNTIHLQKEL